MHSVVIFSVWFFILLLYRLYLFQEGNIWVPNIDKLVVHPTCVDFLRMMKTEAPG